jgi:membrane protein implicated in regulation of membrane protease activity
VQTKWLEWYYLIFLLPAGLSVLVLLLSGLSSHGGGHHDAGGAHAGGDAMHGIHAHAHDLHGGHGDAAHAHGAHAGSHDAGHGGDHGHDGHHGAAHGEGTSLAQRALSFFGIGRAPITISSGSLMLGWGLCGYVAVETLRPTLRLPGVFILPSLGAAAAGALVFAKVFGEIAARLIPQDESFALTRDSLVGLTATVVYPVSETEGRIHVFDAFRTLHVEPARTAAGRPPIPRGADVTVVALDPEQDNLIVEPSPGGAAPPAA